MRFCRLFYAFLFFFCLTCSLGWAQVGKHGVPIQPSDYITDVGKILTQEQEDVLNDTLKDFESRTTHQVLVLIVDSLYGMSIDEFGPAVANSWKLGQAGNDNGVLMTISMKDRKMRIDVGYGLEADLTDVEAKYILDGRVKPNFRTEAYWAGVYRGVLGIMEQIDTAYIAEQERLEVYREKKSLAKILIWEFERKLIAVYYLASWAVLCFILGFLMWGLWYRRTHYKKVKLTTKSVWITDKNRKYAKWTPTLWLTGTLSGLIVYAIYMVYMLTQEGLSLDGQFFWVEAGFIGRGVLGICLISWVGRVVERENRPKLIGVLVGFELLTVVFFMLMLHADYQFYLAEYEMEFGEPYLKNNIFDRDLSYMYTIELRYYIGTSLLFYGLFYFAPDILKGFMDALKSSGGGGYGGGRTYSSGRSYSSGSSYSSGGGFSGGSFGGGGGGSFGGGGASSSW